MVRIGVPIFRVNTVYLSISSAVFNGSISGQ